MIKSKKKSNILEYLQLSSYTIFIIGSVIMVHFVFLSCVGFWLLFIIKYPEKAESIFHLIKVMNIWFVVGWVSLIVYLITKLGVDLRKNKNDTAIKK